MGSKNTYTIQISMLTVLFRDYTRRIGWLYDISCNSLGCDQNKIANTGVKGAMAAWMQFVAYKWLKMHMGCLEVAISGSPNVTSNERRLGNVASRKLLACSGGIGITFTKERCEKLALNTFIFPSHVSLIKKLGLFHVSK
ncbi:uncharacterized protein LOC110752053 [Prunus avium]|uniref:Uncharacterized protein LOC110752053 n=1 Tax=Prunus avium TaxID=42229 RepID=A0A6P5S0X6_PRUAV|nr:uncharacterized protein LOC110752053 [Prunus avium]